jgi:hypothetical protein
MDGNRMSSGFYKYESDSVSYGPNFVIDQNFELRAESKDEHTYPVDGWYWFDTMEDAYAFFNIPMPEGENE